MDDFKKAGMISKETTCECCSHLTKQLRKARARAKLGRNLDRNASL